VLPFLSLKPLNVYRYLRLFTMIPLHVLLYVLYFTLHKLLLNDDFTFFLLILNIYKVIGNKYMLNR